MISVGVPAAAAKKPRLFPRTEIRALCAGAAPSHAQPVVAAHGLQPPTALLVDGPLFTKTKVLKGLAPILVWLQSFLNTVIRFVF